MCRYWYSILFFLGIISSVLNAQNYHVQLQSLDTEYAINNIIHSQNGYIWLGTNNGISRYDAHEFIHYTAEKHGLFSNRVYILAEDKKGRLWLNGQDGYVISKPYIFDPKLEKATPLEEAFTTPLPFSLDSIISIGNYADNQIWIATTEGMFTYEQESFTYRFACDPKFDWSLFSLRYDSIQNGFWTRLDPKHTDFKNEKTFARLIGLDGHIRDEFSTPDGSAPLFIYWLATEIDDFSLFIAGYGNHYNRVYKKFNNGRIVELNLPNDQYYVRYDEEHLVSIQDNTIRLYDFEGNSTLSAPVYLPYERKLHFVPSLIDTQGGIWIPSNPFKKLDIIYLEPNKFNTFLKNNARPLQIRGIQENSKGVIYTASGLYKGLYQLKNNEIHIINDELRHLGMWLENDDTIWLGVDDPYLHRYIVSNNTFERYNAINLPYNNIVFWSFYQDRENTIWVGSSRGIWQVNKADKTLIPFGGYNAFEELKTSTILHFHENETGIWLATSSGLYLWDLDEGIIDHYHVDGNENHFLPHNNLAHIHEDEDGIFWLASKGGGLIRWNPKTKKHRQFDQENGLSHNVIYGVYGDKYGYLWMSSDYGINRFHKETAFNTIYTDKDGLTNNEFNTISHYQGADGQLYFGSINGLNSFHPKDFVISDASQTNVFKVTNLTITNLEDEIRSIPVHQLNNLPTITLTPNDKAFELSFALLDYQAPSEHQFAYKIEGLDKNWSYTSVPNIKVNKFGYGDYTLLVKGKTAQGDWNEPIALNLQLLKPFYQKTWFILLVFSSIIGIVILIARWRISSYKERQKELEQEVAKRTAKIEEDKKLIEIQASELLVLDKLKSRFFVNISHELRTPLTLILGPLTSIMGKPGSMRMEVFRQLQVMEKNGKNLLKLVNEILDLSKIEDGKLEIHEETVLFAPFLEKIYTAFTGQASDKKINLVLENHIDSTIILLFDSNKVEKILNNLLSNALKFTSLEGEVIVQANPISKDEFVLTVRDNGRGIHPDDIDFIFDRFYQTKQTDHLEQGGTGVGLALVRELARLLGGDITVESQWGKGASFMLLLPYKVAQKVVPLHHEEALVEEVIAPVATPIAPSVPKVIDKERYTILVVEDNPDMRTFIVQLLDTDYNVFTASNGQEAWTLLEKPPTKIHLVLSDIMMPVMDGFELLERIKNHDTTRALPTLMLTARANEYDRLQALTIGVDGYITKPFSPRVLQSHIHSMLHNYSLRHQWIKEIDANKSDDSSTNEVLTVADQQWIKKVEGIIRTELVNETFSVTVLADTLALSSRQLTRKLKKIIGLSPAKYIREIRLQIAREHLEKGTFETVSEVGYAVGFSKIPYFSQLFSARFGQPPSQYIR